MQTVCILNGRIIMAQGGEAVETMTANAAQYPGAVVELMEDSVFEERMAEQSAPPDKKQETLSISQQMISSGIFKPVLVMLNDYYLTKIKALPAAAGMIDEQIIEALSNPASPYYEPDFVKVQNYFSDLMSV